MTTPALQPLPAPTCHQPERTCVACRRKAPQRNLLRLSRDAQGLWQLGQTGGRGAYLCQRAECCTEKRLKRSFGAQAGRVAEQLHTKLTAAP